MKCDSSLKWLSQFIFKFLSLFLFDNFRWQDRAKIHTGRLQILIKYFYVYTWKNKKLLFFVVVRKGEKDLFGLEANRQCACLLKSHVSSLLSHHEIMRNIFFALKCFNFLHDLRWLAQRSLSLNFKCKYLQEFL